MSIDQMVKYWLEIHGFDGLVRPGKCACRKKALFPCGRPRPECRQGILSDEGNRPDGTTEWGMIPVLDKEEAIVEARLGLWECEDCRTPVDINDPWVRWTGATWSHYHCTPRKDVIPSRCLRNGKLFTAQEATLLWRKKEKKR